MKFGMFYNLRFPGPWSSEREFEFLWQVLEQITYAEEMGIEGLWLTEHHFEKGLVASAPETVLSAISQRTSKMRLGFAVVLSPIHHPLHVAAKVATLDLLSNGRVDLGIGRASSPHQLAPFGVALEDTRGMMNEAISMLPNIWTEDVFSHEGRYYNVPPREVVPKPRQKPHPPIWAACNQEDTSRKTGEQGLGFITHGRAGPQRVGALVDVYRDAIKTANPVGKFIHDRVAVDTLVFCDENGPRARERGAEAAAEQQRENSTSFGRFWAGISEDSVPEEYKHHYQRYKRSATQQSEITPENIVESGGFCVGNPDSCIEFIEKFEALGVDEYVVTLQVGSVTHQEVMNSLRLFGKYVIPHFQEKERKALASAQAVSADN